MTITLQKKATAIHEAGHAVIAISQGLSITKISIQPDEDYRGVVVHPPLPDNVTDERHPRFNRDKQRIALEARVITSLAGAVAEFEYYRVIGHPKSKGWLTVNRGAQSDRAQASRLIIRLASSEEEIKAYVNWLFIRTQNTVKHLLHWQAIEAVQDALLQHTLLRGKDVKEIYKEAFKIKSR
jgi:hypothetical protein